MFISIDGKSCECEQGELIVDVARRNGIDIPTLCHHEGLRGQGSCRVCIVEMNGRIVPACVTKIDRECQVQTSVTRVKEARGVILSMLKKRAPNSPEIDAMLIRFGTTDLPRLKIVPDGNRCILCGLCVRACQSLGNGAISTVLRGIRKEVTSPYGEPAPTCIGCGSCASVCPTGSIVITDEDGVRTIWNKKFRLVYCVQCGSVIGTEEYIVHFGIKEKLLCDECRKFKTASLVNSEMSCR